MLQSGLRHAPASQSGLSLHPQPWSAPAGRRTQSRPAPAPHVELEQSTHGPPLVPHAVEAVPGTQKPWDMSQQPLLHVTPALHVAGPVASPAVASAVALSMAASPNEPPSASVTVLSLPPSAPASDSVNGLPLQPALATSTHAVLTAPRLPDQATTTKLRAPSDHVEEAHLPRLERDRAAPRERPRGD